MFLIYLNNGGCKCYWGSGGFFYLVGVFSLRQISSDSIVRYRFFTIYRPTIVWPNENVMYYSGPISGEMKGTE